MKKEILTIEKENIKTREKSTDDMVDAIRKIIVDESGKTY